MSDIRMQRLTSQGLARPSFTEPAAVVRWMGAVQAQVYPDSLWAIGLRMEQAEEQAVEQAIAARTIVRTWPMRGTIHFVPAEDTRWMLELMARRAIPRARSIHQKAGLDESIFARGREVFARALEGGRQRTRPDLYALLEAEGINTSDTRGLHIIGRLAHEGLICFGAREGKQPTLVLLEEWAPNQRALAHEEALAEIALRYFRSHGPATIQDFAWWSGLPVTEAKKGLEAVKAQFSAETIDGKTYWWAERAHAGPAPSPSVHLLPSYDEYLVSYKDRSAALDPQHTWLQDPRTHLGPVIVIDGQVVGAWKRRLQNGAGEIETTCARDLTAAESAGLETAIQRFRKFRDAV